MLVGRELNVFFFFNDTATTEIYTLSLHDALPIYYILKEEDNFQINPQEFVNSVKESKSNLAIIINPNNPTGILEPREKIQDILEQLPNTKVIVDESFIDFSGDREKYSMQDLVGRYPNLIIIRSISKEFGVPGLRLGYLLTTNQEVKEKIKESLPIWNINSLAEFFLELFIKIGRAHV